MTESIRVVHQAGIVSLFLNRPERRNALSLALLARLSAALSDEVGEDTAALTISGVDECFSAGADLSDMNGTPEDLRMEDAIEEVTDKIRALPMPVIAAIDGPCLGGAFDLAMSCDLRIAAEDAYFQVPAIRFSLFYNPRSTVRMCHGLGRDTVFRLIVLGERFDADAALHAGIVSHVVGSASYAAALQTAQTAAANSIPVMAATKRLLNEMEDADFDPEEWQAYRRRMLASPERHEAILAAKKSRGY